MSAGNNKNNNDTNNTHQPSPNTPHPTPTNWVDIDLGAPRHKPQAITIAQLPGWTSFDLESNTPPSWKKERVLRLLHSKASKIVVGGAILAMLLIGVIVPTVVAVRKRRVGR